MKHMRTVIAGAVILSVMVSSGCSSVPIAEKNEKYIAYVTKDGIHDDIKSAQGFYKVAENEYLELYVDGESAEIAVKDKDSAMMWYSNPKDRENDYIASGDSIADLNSQVKIEYIDNYDHIMRMNSYEDCILYDKHEFAKVENGFSVTYKIGEKNTLFRVPLVIRQERFEAFLSKMNEDDQFYVLDRYDFITLEDKTDEARKLLLKDYPSLSTNHNLYVLTNMSMPDFVMESLDEIFAGAGYDVVELNFDNTENLLEPSPEPLEFIITVEYTLDGNNLLVKIPHDRIKTSSAVKLTKIYLLNFFGAAGANEDGYIFVPDGCGALINLNNSKQNYEPYQNPIYGRDNTILEKQLETIKQQCYLPVFGLKKDDSAFLAVIEKGDSAAFVRADVSGRSNLYNSVSAWFEVMKSSIQSLPYGDYPDINMFAKRPLGEDIQIRYMFLYGEDTDYSAMALTYQKYLSERGLLNKNEFKDDIPFALRMIGTVDYKASFLLTPIKRYKRLTGYSDAQEVLQKLKVDGISNIYFEYLSWANGGFNNTINNKMSFIKVLGGKQKFGELVSYAMQNGVNLYPAVDFMYVGDRKGFSVNKSASRFIPGQMAYKYEYDSASNLVNRKTGKYIVKPSVMEEHTRSFLHDYKKHGNFGISIPTFGTDLNSDFSDINGSNREESQKRIVESLKFLADSGYDVVSSGANAYTLKYLSHIYNMPVQSSGYYIIDRSVPFYQIVLHGYISYSGPDINLSGHLSDSLLKTLEFGASPSFLWTCKPNYEFKNTGYDYYSTSFKNWYTDAISIYNTLNEVLGQTQRVLITRHEEVSAGVFRTAYSNGISVIVNYNDENISVDRVVVPAKGYSVIKEA